MTLANTLRKVSWLIAAAALAGVAAPAALADPPQGHPASAPPDLIERYVINERAASVGGQGAATPDLVERAVARELDAVPVRPDDRGGVRTVATSEPTSPVVALPGDGFHWGDATVGAGATVAALLLVGALAVSLRRRRPAHGVTA